MSQKLPANVGSASVAANRAQARLGSRGPQLSRPPTLHFAWPPPLPRGEGANRIPGDENAFIRSFQATSATTDVATGQQTEHDHSGAAQHLSFSPRGAKRTKCLRNAYSISRSAGCSSDTGIERPRAFAVFIFKTNSNLAGRSIGSLTRWRHAQSRRPGVLLGDRRLLRSARNS